MLYKVNYDRPCRPTTSENGDERFYIEDGITKYIFHWNDWKDHNKISFLICKQQNHRKYISKQMWQFIIRSRYKKDLFIECIYSK